MRRAHHLHGCAARLAVAAVAVAAITTTAGVAFGGLGVPSATAATQPVPWRPATPPPARGDLTTAQVQDLARRAMHDPAALAELRSVRSVDGRPVDLRAALAITDPNALDARLRELAGDSSTPLASAPAQARDAAGSVLDQARFHSHEPPRPLRGVLTWIGNRLEPVFEAIGSFYEWLIPRGLRLPILGGILVVVAGLMAVGLTRRRSRASVERRRRLAGLVEEAADPRELERRADAAEAQGRYGEAVRLRFLAGLVRLDRSGVVEVRTSETTGQLRAALADGDFDSLATAFDEIVYGGRDASAGDVAAARAGWSLVLAPRRQTVAAAP